MAQETQIVPKFLHSHVETYINDYTQFNEEVSTPVDTNSKFISVFRSSKGIDNVFVKKNDLSDFTKTYGKSDYNKYGQPLMMPIAMLKSGSATVYCMRVMPDDAFAANSILTLCYKEETATNAAEEEVRTFKVKFEVSNVEKSTFTTVSDYSSNAKIKKRLKGVVDGMLLNPAERTDGYTAIPIMSFRMMGRGTYGNKYRYRIARNIDYEKDYGIKLYSFEALDIAEGTTKVSTYVGSLVTSSQFNSITLINDVIDDAEVGAAVMDVYSFEENIEKVYDAYKAFVSKNGTVELPVGFPDLDEFDPFFGKQVGTTLNMPNFDVCDEHEVTTEELAGDPSIKSNYSVDRPQGIPLAGGDDGAFKTTATDEAFAEAEIECYKNAFNGNYDRLILSSRRIPCDALLDANYPYEVKHVLADLAIARNDCMCFIDSGIETTIDNIDDIITSNEIFSTRNISKEFQHYQVRDTSTKKKCEVTITYFYAQSLANHYRNNGSHIPFVKSISQLTGHVKNSLQPSIDDVDTDIKEKLYINRINYYEAIDENVYQRCSQNTAQPANSDLMEENNMNTLFAMKRQIERDCWNDLYDFTSAEDRARFTESEKAKFSPWVGTKIASFDLKFDVTEWEMERSIIHCYVSVQFRSLNKRTIIEIDVNKRDFLS